MAWLPDLESLQLLVLVGERGSLTAAAADLGVSQPAASKRMLRLERRLGVRLLDRSTRGSALTPAGVLACGWAQRVLDALGSFVDGMEVLRRERSGQLTVAASLTVAEHLLPAWIGELRQRQPELHIGLQVMNSARVVEQVGRGSVDLGFIESPERLTELHTRLVTRDRLVLVVAPNHRWARRRRPVGPAELAATPLVSREVGSGTRETADRALAAAGAQVAAPLLELGSGAAVRNAVAAGAGPALISELAVASDLAQRTLVEVPTVGLDLRRALRAVWRQGSRPTGPAGELLACAFRRSPRA